ncbi:MAG TPA: hypothetical protein VGI05_15760 [Streptosporangiaceae bacterium]|jgi:hypothetical protein
MRDGRAGPGAAGLLWLWSVVAALGPGDPPDPPSWPALNRDHDFREPIGPPKS